MYERCGHTAGRNKEGGRAVGWQRDREIKRKGEKERVSQDAPPATDCTLVALTGRKRARVLCVSVP